MSRHTVAYRSEWIAASALLAVSTALCWVPLFNLLAYEFAFALCLPVTWVAATQGIRARQRAADRPVRAWLSAGARATALALLPLIPISLNALRVRNCNFLAGVAFYAVLPLVTAWVAAGWGVAAAAVSPSRPRLLMTAVFVVSLVPPLATVWWAPPVDAYHAFLGYYPGSLYDEAIPISARLLISRGEDLAWAAAAVIGASARPWGLKLAAALLLVIPARVVATQADVHRTTRHVRAALGAVTQTARARIWHPAEWTPQKRARFAAEVEFALTELGDFLRVTPTAPLDVYFYPNRDTKKRLMGAARVRIAKPWQRAVHLHAPRIGQPVLIHELAHALSAEIADAPHHLPLRYGVLPNMGLIEGLAVAATWDEGALDPHQWSAALHRIDRAPPIERLLDPTTFLASHSGTAYTLCGSFVRFYHDRHGASLLGEVYRTGDFSRAGAALKDEAAAWRAHLAALPLTDLALAEARARFDRPAIFRKVCAHEIAALRQQQEDRQAKGDHAGALASVEAILSHVPRDVSGRLSQIHLLARLGRMSDATVAAQAVVSDPKAGAVPRARAAEALADLRWLEDADADAARAGWLEVQARAFERGDRRRLACKLAALDAGQEEKAATLGLLVGPPPPEAVAAGHLATLARRADDWPLAAYLVARDHLRRGQRAEARPLLLRTLGRLGDASIELEAARLLAAADFEDGEYTRAAMAFAKLSLRADLDLERGERDHLARWARRAAFFARWPA